MRDAVLLRGRVGYAAHQAASDADLVFFDH